MNPFLIVLMCGAITFFSRAVAFLLFPETKEIPPVIDKLKDVLPAALMGLLVIYCMKDATMADGTLISGVVAMSVTAGLHFWKRNIFLSIAAGTIVYMFLIQRVF